jgi:hypothetical protein
MTAQAPVRVARDRRGVAAPPRPRGGRGARLREAARRHRPILALLAVALGARVIVQVAYRPAILNVDSFRYLANVGPLDPGGINPIGYELFLRPVLWLGGLVAVPAVQHLLGLAMAVTLYALLVRRGAASWLAALATVPVLFDAYQLQIEQNVLSDVPFQVLLVAALAVLTWRPVPGHAAAAATGALLAAAVIVRLVGWPLIVAALACLLAARLSWRARATRAVLLCCCFALPLLAYAGYYSAYYHGADGTFTISRTDGAVLYGRVATFVDCARLPLPAYERALCPDEPPDRRASVDYYTHDLRSPWRRVKPPAGMGMADVQRDFARRAILNQPVEFAASVAVDFAKGFAPVRRNFGDDVPIERWQFQLDYPAFHGYDPAALARAHGSGGVAVVKWLTHPLRAYQLHGGYVPGPLLALALLAGVAGSVRAGRGRDGGLGPACLAWTAAGAGVLLTAAVFEFSWRYQLPGLVLLPVAGVLGVTELARRAGERAAERSAPDAVDEAALRDFRARHGTVRLGPVTVVIAAYNEAEGIGRVLDSIPATAHGLAVDRLVVVDGSTDATAETALAHGALVCVAPVNRGQGAALRLGYRIVREAGGRYVVTTDADGQYDARELPRLLTPLLRGGADFVTGSRRLGRQETDDPVRHLGVTVFAAAVSLLTGRRVTDTSFGFRAMTAELTGAVVLAQPQYQSSELLVGALARGFRVAELPMTIRPRTNGHSKKGGNLTYGLRYTLAVVGTWFRECLAPRHAAAGTVIAPSAHPAGGRTGRT